MKYDVTMIREHNTMKYDGTVIISIVFFILSFFLLMASFFMLAASPLAGFVYLVITGVFVYTNIQLMGMGISISNMNVNAQSIDSFFTKCKNYFIVWGVVLIIYLVMVVIAISSGLMGATAMLKQFM